MCETMRKGYLSLIKAGTLFQPVILLAIRLFWGWQFFDTGKNKLLNISPIIDYFGSLGIPFPTLNAYAVGTIECVGGLCLLLGFATRLAAIPLMVVMLVAMMTAHYEEFANLLSDPQGVVGLSAFSFFLTSLIVFAFGAGAISLDALIKRFSTK